MGKGQHQVTKRADRVERSVSVAIMASLLLLTLRARDIPADQPWSAFRRQRAFGWEVVQGQGERLPGRLPGGGFTWAKLREVIQLPIILEYHMHRTRMPRAGHGLYLGDLRTPVDANATFDRL